MCGGINGAYGNYGNYDGYGNGYGSYGGYGGYDSNGIGDSLAYGYDEDTEYEKQLGAEELDLQMKMKTDSAVKSMADQNVQASDGALGKAAQASAPKFSLG